jgi:hypothetical protein
MPWKNGEDEAFDTRERPLQRSAETRELGLGREIGHLAM